LDLRWDFDDTRYVKTGLKYSSTDRELDESQRCYNPGSRELTLGTSAGVKHVGFMNEVEDYLVHNLWMDVDAMNDFFNQAGNEGYFAADPGDDFVSANAADYGVEETITAAYIMGGMTLQRLELIGGVRVEHTNV